MFTLKNLILIIVAAGFFSLTFSVTAADKRLEAIIAAYADKVNKSAKDYESRKNKYRRETIKKLSLLKKSRMQKGNLEGANDVEKVMKKLKDESSTPSSSSTALGTAPQPPAAPGAGRKNIRKYRKAKSIEEVNKALKALNPGYQMNGRFETEDGRIVLVNLDNCYITNIAPLAGLKQLHTVEIGDNHLLWDISPLKGKNLHGLSIYNTDVRNLDAVKNCRLDWLNMTNTKIKDISDLKKMPLINLQMGGCLLIDDISPIEKCKELEELIIPVQALDMDIKFLKKFKRLRILDTRFRPQQKTVEQFWEDIKRRR